MGEPTTAPSPSALPVHRAPKLVDAYLNSPFAGIAPWILMSLFSGPGRFEVSACAALFLSLMTFVLGRRKGGTVKLMDVFDLIFFTGFVIVGILGSRGVITWMEMWAGELTNLALTAFVVITILMRQPFTLQYAKESTDPSLWDNPVFLRINYTICWVWGAAFAFQSVMGLYSDAIIKNNNNFWSSWILQIAALVFAISFTEFWPDYARSKARGEPGPPKSDLLDWIPVFVLISGVAGLITDSLSTFVGVALIVVGGVGISALQLLKPKKTDALPNA